MHPSAQMYTIAGLNWTGLDWTEMDYAFLRFLEVKGHMHI